MSGPIRVWANQTHPITFRRRCEFDLCSAAVAFVTHTSTSNTSCDDDYRKWLSTQNSVVRLFIMYFIDAMERKSHAGVFFILDGLYPFSRSLIYASLWLGVCVLWVLHDETHRVGACIFQWILYSTENLFYLIVYNWLYITCKYVMLLLSTCYYSLYIHCL